MTTARSRAVRSTSRCPAAWAGRRTARERRTDARSRQAGSGTTVIALDTNVLVRYIVEDDAKQTALAAALIDRAIAEDDVLFVSDVVVCETVWVLGYSYHVGREEIARVLGNL